jgi:hypothetical protein
MLLFKSILNHIEDIFFDFLLSLNVECYLKTIHEGKINNHKGRRQGA